MISFTNNPKEIPTLFHSFTFLLVWIGLSLFQFTLFAGSDTTSFPKVHLQTVSYNYAIVDFELALPERTQNDLVGICWNTTGNPTLSDNLVLDTGFQTKISLKLHPLPANTAVYFRLVTLINGQTRYAKTEEFNTAISPENLKIGDFYQGGVIAHFFTEKDTGYVAGELHGFVVSPQDIGVSQWGCFGEHTGTIYNFNSGFGGINTERIINFHNNILFNYLQQPRQCDPRNNGTIAAYLCDTLHLNGYNDWFLPCLTEMTQIRMNLHEKELLVLRNFPDLYWTSSEEREGRNGGRGLFRGGNAYAYATRMSTAIVNIGTPKYEKAYVRAIRYF